MLYNHDFLQDIFGAQSYYQHTFTPDVRLDDVLLSIENTIEYILEFDTPIWLMSVDMCKMFDSIEYDSLFDALTSHGLAWEYVILLHQWGVK